MNKQPEFCGKQHSTRFTVKRQKMLTLISNPENFCSASLYFRLSVCKHKVLFSPCVQKALNTRLETIEHKQSTRKLMPLHKRTPQGQARRLKQGTLFGDAPHNNTTLIHLLFRFQKALHTPHSRHTMQQPTAARTKSVQSRMHK